MRVFQNTLRILGVAVIGVALIHIILGPSAEVLFGSSISPSSIADPTIDSQNRFYGAAFALYGGVFLLSSTDVPRYRQLLFIGFGIFFAAGLSRIVSIVVTGWPPLPVLGLAVVELAGPPLMAYWLVRVLRRSTQAVR